MELELKIILYFINRALMENVIDEEMADELKNFANYLDENLDLVEFYFNEIQNKKYKEEE